MSEQLRMSCAECGSSFVLDGTTVERREWEGKPGAWLAGVVCPVCKAWTVSYGMTPALEEERQKLAAAK